MCAPFVACAATNPSRQRRSATVASTQTRPDASSQMARINGAGGTSFSLIPLRRVAKESTIHPSIGWNALSKRPPVSQCSSRQGSCVVVVQIVPSPARAR
jgi:hypothetical protein